jgi:hypothetical protein
LVCNGDIDGVRLLWRGDAGASDARGDESDAIVGTPTRMP